MREVRNEYEKRLLARRRARTAHEATFRRIGTWRLLIVLAGAVLVWWNLLLLPLPVAGFIALVIWHERVAQRSIAERRAEAFYERGLARLDGRWPGTGPTGDHFRAPEHPYAEDLDLFGNGSVFQLISGARTRIGEETLARWLCERAGPEVVLERQQAIEQLRARLDLREDLALLGDELQSGVHPEALSHWAEAPIVRFPPGAAGIAFALGALSAAAFAGYMFHLWHWRWPLLGVLLGLAWSMTVAVRVRRVLESVEARGHDLDVLALVLERFEQEEFASGRLAHLRRELTVGGATPSRQLARLRRLVEYHDWTHNLGFRPIARLFVWSEQNAMAIERWRARFGSQVRQWLAAVGELEALSSLAGYAAEHPDDVFPALLEAGPLFDGERIAHPLIPRSAAVRNDVRLDSGRRLLVVSGSNMSGKTTLLRAVGLNAVLAWAGAPVCATALRLSPLAVGAAIRVQDSVLEGKSRFYGEITRVRQIVDMAAGSAPLLFLLDEMLSGTNSHDRRIGAEAILRTLVDRGALGLITTHDLALAEIADALATHAANVHFEDHIEEGHIAFDYRMRPGVVTRSNALALMRSVGLEV
ncbi:MAG TPA: hypothetical protein VFL57_02890 [Bryobacteraceae bacterium]|nr:hypothetical protein [Bryobacteraceae bacterium]